MRYKYRLETRVSYLEQWYILFDSRYEEIQFFGPAVFSKRAPHGTAILRGKL